ncbi:MAG TPA: histidine phosphatase family protein [Acidimicrobiales bacterium]|nr:histidine phosphatase family protein [Acidimicrobiales bacterium]
MVGVVVWMARHGQTEWSASGRHTSWTELPLTSAGEQEARALGRVVHPEQFALVLASPRQRALRTAELAGFEPQIDDDLVEWDYGDFEGLTTDEIQAKYPGWNLWEGPWPGGETAAQVAERTDRVIARALAQPAPARVFLFSHGHLLRVLAARWLRQPPSSGRLLRLVTGTLSVLGWEHGEPVVEHWSVPPGGEVGHGPMSTT